MEIAERKAMLRAALAERRRAVPRDAAQRAAMAVARRVETLPAFAAAGSVALYAALPDELPTRPLFDAVRQHGKAALLPRLDGERMVFAVVERWEDLVPGRHGVLEPPPATPPAQPDLVLVPAVAYDRRGRRLGRGAGWYDRALGELGRSVTLVGVGYEFQMLEEVPEEPWDRPVDAIVTERALHVVRLESRS